MLTDIEKTFSGHISYYNSPIHGLSHLREVSALAGRIAVLEEVDSLVAAVTGFLHDVGRRSDWPDGGRHALDSARTARTLIERLYPHLDANVICDIIARHADGLVTTDKLAGCVWDADRLTLRRLGRPVLERFLSTDAAKEILRRNDY